MSEETTKYGKYGEMMICADCFEIYGPWHCKGEAAGGTDKNLFQLCGRDCPSRNQKPNMLSREVVGAKWPGFDFNMVVELCHCCGQEVLSSGSKWSVWFCEECKERVIQFNTRYRRTIIPIGRHSLMAGYSLGQEEARKPEAIRAFAENLSRLSSNIDRLAEWKSLVLAENFKIIGYLNDAPLLDYLAQTRKLPGKSTFFVRLRDFFELELRGGQPS